MANYLAKYGKRNQVIEKFYIELRENNLDLFIFDTYYITMLHDRKREFDKNDSVKFNKDDLEELSGNVPISGMNHEEKIREGLLKPFREIYWFEKSAFDKKGFHKLLEKKRIVLPDNITSVLANDYR